MRSKALTFVAILVLDAFFVRLLAFHIFIGKEERGCRVQRERKAGQRGRGKMDRRQRRISAAGSQLIRSQGQGSGPEDYSHNLKVPGAHCAVRLSEPLRNTGNEAGSVGTGSV